MSPVDGLRALLEIKAQLPQTKVIIVSQYDDAGLRAKALRAGACAYVLKENQHELPGILMAGLSETIAATPGATPCRRGLNPSEQSNEERQTMKPMTKYLTVALATFLALGAARPCAAQIPANALPLPSGYPEGVAFAVNAGGQAAGWVTGVTGSEAACLWKADGTLVVLPLLNGYGSAVANAINDSGVVVGHCESMADPKLWHATAWTPNAAGGYTATDLGVLAGETGSDAVAINAQGQILCNNGYPSYYPYFLWENSVQTKVALADGTPIDAGGMNSLYRSALLSSDGRVAGTVYWDIESEGVVLWQKTSSGDIVITKVTGGPEDSAQAISPNGIIGYSHGDGLYLYDANTATTTPVDSTPRTSADGSITYTPVWISSVNDQGQAVVEVIAEDNITGAYGFVPYFCQSGALTQIPVDSLLPAGSGLYQAIGVINNSGQVVGYAMYYPSSASYSFVSFGWSASTGIVELAPPSGSDMALPVALNDSGLVVGAGMFSSTESYVPVTWNLSAPVSALTISGATATRASSKSPNVTVTITNPSTTDTAYNVTVTAASLNGVGAKSALPLVYGTLKPGQSKQCKLQFSSKATGDQTLTIDGTSSLGDFFTTQTVHVP